MCKVKESFQCCFFSLFTFSSEFSRFCLNCWLFSCPNGCLSTPVAMNVLSKPEFTIDRHVPCTDLYMITNKYNTNIYYIKISFKLVWFPFTDRLQYNRFYCSICQWSYIDNAIDAAFYYIQFIKQYLYWSYLMMTW